MSGEQNDDDGSDTTTPFAKDDGPESESQSFSEEITAELPDEPSTAEHDNSIAAVADELRDGVVGVTSSLMFATSRVIPFTSRFYKGLYAAGLKGLWKKSGADYLGMIQVGGEIKPVPVNWDYEKQRFENSHGDWWKAPTEGEYQYRMAGKVPTIWASATSNHVGSHIQAEVAEALDLGQDQALYKNASVQMRKENTTAEAGSSDSPAMADGGSAVNFTVTGVQPGIFSDQVVPLTSQSDADARVVSMEKYYETYPAVVDPEEMKMQEKRGEMSMNDRDMGKFAMKMMLIAAAVIAVVVLGPDVVAGLFGSTGGGGGGGGGSTIPITLGLI